MSWRYRYRCARRKARQSSDAPLRFLFRRFFFTASMAARLNPQMKIHSRPSSPPDSPPRAASASRPGTRRSPRSPGTRRARLGAARLRDAPASAPAGGLSRPSKNFDTPIGIFEGQSDIGGPLCRAAPVTTPARSNTPSTPPATTSGTTATNSAISGRRCPATFRSRPTSRSRTRTASATARPSSSSARTSMTIPRRPWPPCTAPG